jgi:chlorite dismutase
MGPEESNDLLVHFIGGSVGQWRVSSFRTVAGDALAQVERVGVYRGNTQLPLSYEWCLSGVMSTARYVTAAEQEELRSKQPPLGRPEATVAALIPIRKTANWWALSYDERRCIFEENSHHIAEGMKYLPGIARQLYRGRDIGEPFDFVTWFEYAPEYSAAFEELVRTLRATEEWRYVDREVDIRLIRELDT